MIDTIFYFPDTELEYLDNYNNSQVKPYTIVFTKDSHSIWKDGIKYGGSDGVNNSDYINNIFETDIKPLLDKYEEMLVEANRLADERYSAMNGSIENLTNTINAVNAASALAYDIVSNIKNSLSSEILSNIENLLKDAEWIEENWPQGNTDWQTGWDDNIEAYLTTVGYWDEDENGNKVTKWSRIEQSIDGVSLSVNSVQQNLSGSISTLQSALDQEITDRGEAISLLSNTYAAKDNTEAVLEWLYSGLKTGVSEDKSFAELVTAASLGDHTGISNINMLVEEQYDDDGNFTGYAANSAFITAVDGSLSALYQLSTGDSTQNVLVSKIKENSSNLAGLITKITGSDAPVAEADIVTAIDGMASGYISKAQHDQAIAELTAASISIYYEYVGPRPDGGSVDTYNDNPGNMFDLPYDMEFPDKIFSLNEFKEIIDGYTYDGSIPPQSYGHGEEYTLHPDDIVCFVNGNYYRIKETTDAASNISLSISKVGDTYVAKNNMTAQVNEALATLEQEVTDGTATNSLISKVNENSSDIAAIVLSITGDSSDAAIETKIGNFKSGLVSHADIKKATAGLVAQDGLTESVAAIIATVGQEGSAITLSADLINFEGSTVLSHAVSTLLATAGFVAENELTGKVASIIATAGEEGSSITLSADLINFEGSAVLLNAIAEEMAAFQVSANLILITDANPELNENGTVVSSIVAGMVSGTYVSDSDDITDSSNSVRLWAGTPTDSTGKDISYAPFYVTKDGILHAKEAQFKNTNLVHSILSHNVIMSTYSSTATYCMWETGTNNQGYPVTTDEQEADWDDTLDYTFELTGDMVVLAGPERACTVHLPPANKFSGQVIKIINGTYDSTSKKPKPSIINLETFNYDYYVKNGRNYADNTEGYIRNTFVSAVPYAYRSRGGALYSESDWSESILIGPILSSNCLPESGGIMGSNTIRYGQIDLVSALNTYSGDSNGSNGDYAWIIINATPADDVYYRKTETYSADEIDEMITDINEEFDHIHQALNQ